MAMSSSQKRRVVGSVVVLGTALIVTLIAGYRAQLGAVERVQSLAREQGVRLEYADATRYPFMTLLRQVTVQSKQAASAQVSIDVLTIRSTFNGSFKVSAGDCHVVLSGDPASVFDRLLQQSKSPLAEISWGRVDVEYSQRLFGKLTLHRVYVERKQDALVVRTDEVALGAARWQNALFSLRRRNQMIEVGLANESPSDAQAQLGYFPSSRGLSQWTLSLKHQPARSLASSLGWELGEEFEATRVAGTLSFVVPEDPARPFRGLLQLVIDRWVHPKWPDGEAFLGNTASFLARIVPSEDPSHWDLKHVDVSLSIFSMIGSGRVSFGPEPRLDFDVRGTRTCAQIQGNTAPSRYLDQVNAYLDSSAEDPTRRRSESAAMRLQVSAERAGKRNVAWQLEQGCGLAEIKQGEFLQLQLPAREETAKP